MEANQLWKIFDSIQAQIRAFDSKAQFTIGICGIAVGLQIAQALKSLEKYHGWPVLVFIHVLASIVSLTLVAKAGWHAISVVAPRVEFDQPESHIFYAHLVRKYGYCYGEATKALTQMPDDQLRDELAGQIQANAILCNIKSDQSLKSMKWMKLALIAYGLSLVVFLGGSLCERTASTHGPAQMCCKKLGCQDMK